MTEILPHQPTDPIFSVRPAGAADAPLLARLGPRLFEQTFGAANDPADMAAYLPTAFSIERVTEVLGDPQLATWIAEDAERASIGYAVLRRASTADGVIAARPAEVQRIYADQAWHGRGIGDALMRACVDRARAWHCDVLWLGVWEENPRAIAFYEKKGFRKVGRQTFLLGQDLQHDYVMALPLT
jgi:ribosomal protein S18 acetylase RimI-like enzyme